MSSSTPSDQLSSDGSDHDNEEVTQKPEARQRTEADKKMDRVLANRRSARRSRERRKKLQQNLEISVAFLSRQNEELSRENNTLKQELRVLVNLVDELCKQRPLASGAVGDAVSLLSQIQTASAATAASAVTPRVSTNGLTNGLANGLNAGLTNGLTNKSLSMLPGGNNNNNSDLLSGLTTEQILAMSQLMTNQNQTTNALFNK